MYWEEKIDKLKDRFSQAQFSVPFSDWSEILMKIEVRFFRKSWPSEPLTDWSSRLNSEILLKVIPFRGLASELAKLDLSRNYWVIIVLGEFPMAKLFVYDCNRESMAALLAMAPGDFYIGDKKYGWLAFFRVDSANKVVSIYQGGDNKTQFSSQ